jgi:hypothetical protein
MVAINKVALTDYFIPFSIGIGTYFMASAYCKANDGR